MTHIISISVLAAAVCSCAATQLPRDDFSAQVAQRGGTTGYPLWPHENLYGWHDYSSEAGVDLRERYLVRSLPRDSSLSRGCKYPLVREFIL